MLDYLRRRLRYDPATGDLIWLARNGGGRSIRTWNARFAGTVAGTPTTRGYRSILIDGQRYAAHRVAWLLAYGEWPQNQIDHIDGDRANNRLANLRPATQSQNALNSRTYKNNSSGCRGVTWKKSCGKWRAQITVDGEVKHLGYFDDFDDAATARKVAANTHFGEFARETFFQLREQS